MKATVSMSGRLEFEVESEVNLANNLSHFLQMTGWGILSSTSKHNTYYKMYMNQEECEAILKETKALKVLLGIEDYEEYEGKEEEDEF
jgi:uncharacterized protein YlbG (UPF0298 family)